ncbi:phage major capsid protein, P2 family [Dechloromonas denitrificans]|uniref:phage major capsid protein, P2 family n=1 Tax=Dechloromonas denitrificans TaxID=281362 RepID=UPI001CF8E882|nr:phage major capsid protein, P2 family [Dechloromonas denitrificans]UCV02284.1 phage major capsid protein, P2 family [Dechloromonas denitrificans]
MNNETRELFNAYVDEIAKLNGVPDASKKFTVSPTIEQKLEKRVQESSGFLMNVNSYPVDELSGEKIGISVGTTIASRTDTTQSDRIPNDPQALDSNLYECKKTDFDTAIRYQTIDTWAKFKDFQTKLRDAIVEQQGRDRLMIGLNGTSAAANTNRALNPLLQDVNIGWLKKLQLESAARYMDQGAAAGSVKVGPGGDYENMDLLIYDMRSNLLAPWFARDNSFIAMCTSDLLDEKYFPLIATHGTTPTESNELDKMLSAKKLGGLAVAEVPFFPARTVFISRLGKNGGSNLSIYWQNGSRRRTIFDNAKRDRIENYESVNEAYVIEDLSAACAAVNIKLPNGAGGWA